MKKWLITLFSVFVLYGCVTKDNSHLSFEIDSVSTSRAPWKVGEVVYEGVTTWELDDPREVKFVRIFLGVTVDGYYLVQEFVENSGETDAPYLIFDEDSVVSKHAVVHGATILRYPNGARYEECLFDRGTTVKPCIAWYRSGEKMWERSTLDGMSHGIETGWYYSGRKMYQCDFDRGVGPCIWWYENGQKMFEGLYNEDNPIGVHKMWDVDGSLIEEVSFDLSE